VLSSVRFAIELDGLWRLAGAWRAAKAITHSCQNAWSGRHTAAIRSLQQRDGRRSATTAQSLHGPAEYSRCRLAQTLRTLHSDQTKQALSRSARISPAGCRCSRTW
jgi:hypothetical protein